MKSNNECTARKRATIQLSFVITSVALFSLLICNSVVAQSYSWKDANGNLVYGSKPPKNASQVSTLKTRTLSRYSSDKVLSRLKNPDSEKKKELETGNEATTSDSTSKPKENSESFLPAELSASSASVNFDASSRISGCTAEVSNSSSSTAINVSVAFEFKDGTLVPAVGPTEIEAEAAATYSIPKDLLPLPLENTDVGAGAIPEVIVHGLLGSN